MLSNTPTLLNGYSTAGCEPEESLTRYAGTAPGSLTAAEWSDFGDQADAQELGVYFPLVPADQSLPIGHSTLLPLPVHYGNRDYDCRNALFAARFVCLEDLETVRLVSAVSDGYPVRLGSELTSVVQPALTYALPASDAVTAVEPDTTIKFTLPMPMLLDSGVATGSARPNVSQVTSAFKFYSGSDEGKFK